MIRLILLFLLLSHVIPCGAQYFDTLHIHYDIGVARLQQKDKSTLDSLAKDIGSRKMLIYSYADYLGSEDPNQHLSDNRANEVKDYLLKKGISPGQIMECTGLGMVKGSGSAGGDVTFRRTDIFIRKENNAVTIEKVKQKPETKLAGKITQINLGVLKPNQTLNLKNIQFYGGSIVVLTSSQAELNNLYNIMHNNPSLKIRLEGHVCCCVYPDGFLENTEGWELAAGRALAVYKYLSGRGIEETRIEHKGFGYTKPLYEDAHTEEENAANRRVEVRILEK